MAKKELNVGLVGYKFIGNAHTSGWSRIPMFFETDAKINLRAICGRDEAWVSENASKLGWQSYETSWRALVERDDIVIIDITAPSNVHKEIAMYAASRGKHDFCEKPLALTVDDAKEMTALARRTGIVNQVGFNYRFVPAILQAKKLIDQGKLGKIFHFRGRFLQDWIIDPEFPLVWRLDKDVCGSGSLGDLGAHVIDTARFLVGEIDCVSAMSETFVKSRPIVERMEGLSGKAGADAPRGEVRVDDATIMMFRFSCGALGVIEATRFAQGHKNDMGFEINGEKGSLRFSFERMNELEYFSADDEEGAQGFRLIQCSEGVHPYAAHWWPAGHVLGYDHTFVHELYEFAQAVARGGSASPDFAEGARCCAVLDAAERSAASGAWAKVETIE